MATRYKFDCFNGCPDLYVGDISGNTITLNVNMWNVPEVVLASEYDAEIRAMRKELNECRSLLTEVIATTPSTMLGSPSIKAAANWLANWNGERL